MSQKFRRLAERYWVAPQITEDDIGEAAAIGVALLINNRPDGEEPGQPNGDDIEAAARRAGIEYLFIPVAPGKIDNGQIDALEAGIEKAKGTILAYCRSGTRSTFLHALVRARAGEPVDEIIREAKTAGYDLASIRPRLEALASSSR